MNQDLYAKIELLQNEKLDLVDQKNKLIDKNQKMVEQLNSSKDNLIKQYELYIGESHRK